MELSVAESLAKILQYQKSWKIWVFEDTTSGAWMHVEDIRVAINYIPDTIDVPDAVIDFSASIRRATQLLSVNSVAGEVYLGEVSVDLLWLVKQVIVTNIADISKEYMDDRAVLSEEWSGTIAEVVVDELMDAAAQSCLESLLASLAGFDAFVAAVVTCSSKVIFKCRQFFSGQEDEFIQFYLKQV